MASTNIETASVDPRDIGTTLTRKPEPPKPKPVLSLAELLTVVWLRSTPSASTKEVNPSTTGVNVRDAQPETT